MLPDPLLAPAEALLRQADLGRLTGSVPLAGGANNRVFRVDAEGGPALLKAYFHHPDDPRDRLGAEFAFLSLAWRHGMRNLPRPLGADRGHRLGLYEFVPGPRLATGEVDAASIGQAIDFFSAANQPAVRADAARLAPASEACFSLAAHLETVTRRLQQLTEIEPIHELDREALDLIRDEVLPIWRPLEIRVRDEAGRLGIGIEREIPAEARCVSPSDFGFHNAIRAPDGRLRFIDFEYAGWDDPAQMVGDFFNQVAVAVPMEHYPRFARAIADLFPDRDRNLARFDMLLPVYAVKWIAIMLNEFRPEGRRRRNFSDHGADIQDRKRRQLGKVRAALDRLRHGTGAIGARVDRA
jgi:hypothetical protein